MCKYNPVSTCVPAPDCRPCLWSVPAAAVVSRWNINTYKDGKVALLHCKSNLKSNESSKEHYMTLQDECGNSIHFWNVIVVIHLPNIYKKYLVVVEVDTI